MIWNKKTGNLVGGHKRLDWLKKRRATEVEVNVVNLSESEEKTLNLALNKHGQGLWDMEKLGLILEELKIDKIDLELTGFDLETEGIELESPMFAVGGKISFTVNCKKEQEEVIKTALDELVKLYPGVAWW